MDALATYDREVAIFLPHPDEWNGRGSAFLSHGRSGEANESYSEAVRFGPGLEMAAASLRALGLGTRFDPKRKKL